MSSGTIGIVANDTARFTAFSVSLAAVQSPPGSQIAWAVGSDIAESRNHLVNERMHGEWIWFMDDDHAFVPDVLTKLLAWNVSVVGPLCLMRQKPFLPTTLIERDKTIDLTVMPSEGLTTVYSTGTAGMLIRRSVFDKFRERWPGKPLFEKRTGFSDDFLFCARLRELEIPIHVDLGQRLGHITTTVVWPDELDDGQKVVSFQISDSYIVHVGYEKEVPGA